MAHTKYIKKQRYKRSLYPNLLMACIASECKQEEAILHPKIVVKENSNILCSDTNAQQRTFIMRWNPEISSHKIRDFEEGMECFLDRDFYYDWSIWDYEKVSIGDRFYMVTVGNQQNGIVMSGTIVSMPYKDVDWSGKGRDVRYVRMNPECMIHPNNSPLILSSSELSQAIPSFNWNEGHSGELLNEQQAILLDALWVSHFDRFSHK